MGEEVAVCDWSSLPHRSGLIVRGDIYRDEAMMRIAPLIEYDDNNGDGGGVVTDWLPLAPIDW